MDEALRAEVVRAAEVVRETVSGRSVFVSCAVWACAAPCRPADLQSMREAVIDYHNLLPGAST